MTADDQTDYPISIWLRLRRGILRFAFRPIFHLLCRVELIGFENIPPYSGYMLAYNHISLFEPPFLLTFWPYAIEAISGAAVFNRPGQDFLVKAYGAIPVHRGKYDRKVIDRMMLVLRAGRPLMIAPEGGRSHEPGLRRAKPGIAYLMDKLNAPVLPVAVIGGTKDMLKRALRGERPRLTMRVGRLFTLPPVEGRGEVRRAARQRNADLIMTHIAALLPPEYRGVYANSQTNATTEGI